LRVGQVYVRLLDQILSKDWPVQFDDRFIRDRRRDPVTGLDGSWHRVLIATYLQRQVIAFDGCASSNLSVVRIGHADLRPRRDVERRIGESLTVTGLQTNSLPRLGGRRGNLYNPNSKILIIVHRQADSFTRNGISKAQVYRNRPDPRLVLLVQGAR
jgi:hypothetical protein